MVGKNMKTSKNTDERDNGIEILEYKRKTKNPKDLIQYFKETAETVYSNKRRQNGDPAMDHFREIVGNLKEILRGSEELIMEVDDQAWPNFRMIGECVGWWHDLVEDFKRFKVGNPFRPESPPRNSESVFINHLLDAAGDDGRYICYCIYKLTFSRDLYKSYSEYMENIFTFQPIEARRGSGQKERGKNIIRKLDVLSAIIKIVDRNSNTAPTEEYNIDSALDEFYQIRAECRNKNESELKERLKDFYDKKKLHEYFSGDTCLKPMHLVDSATEWFKKKMVANALDNLTFYFPKAEAKLFIELGMDEEGDYSVKIMNEKITFKHKKLRGLMKNGYRDSLTILDEAGIFPKRNVDFIMRLGMNRGVQCTKDYKSILKELLKEGR